MAHELITFQNALEIAKDCPNKHLLTGNGFSMAWKNSVFNYESLFKQADFSNLNPNIKKVFEAFNTRDFEIVMRYLKKTAEVLKIYEPEQTAIISQLENDAEQLKAILVNAIASSHPEGPADITYEEYSRCRAFLSNFKNLYTLNYDLLLYWTYMQFQETEETLKSDDGFRTPDYGKAEYVSWEIENTNTQNVYYLHGALHLFDAGAELQKYTWVNTGIKLIDQIRAALDKDYFPLFVSEGNSFEKLEKITHSNYLSRGMRSLKNIGGALFIYGHSLALNDSHILNIIPKSNVKKVFVSIFGDINSPENREVVKAAEKLKNARPPHKQFELYFYDATSAHVWH